MPGFSKSSPIVLSSRYSLEKDHILLQLVCQQAKSSLALQLSGQSACLVNRRSSLIQSRFQTRRQGLLSSQFCFRKHSVLLKNSPPIPEEACNRNLPTCFERKLKNQLVHASTLPMQRKTAVVLSQQGAYATGRLEDSRPQNDEKMLHETVHSQSYVTSFRHSAALSVPAVLLRKLPNEDKNSYILDLKNRGNAQ